MGLKLSGVSKGFGDAGHRVEVLSDVSLEMAAGESLAITGPSGSGKSTLLHIVGALDRPDSGQVTLDGDDPYALAERDLAAFRNERVGFVFQDHHLLPQYSVLENVLIPTQAFGRSPADAPQRARELLDRVGLAHRLTHRPAQLSGGERQRVAVARALINRPKLLLCDEPTGSLDHDNATGVADLLFELHRAASNILICVTHSAELAARFGRREGIADGKLAA